MTNQQPLLDRIRDLEAKVEKLETQLAQAVWNYGEAKREARRGWIGLTDEEMKQIQIESWNIYPEQSISKFDAWKCQRLTGEKLKEKNT